MDTQDRQTASAYINNLLLSRGLLRNGTPIEFAKPGETEGGVNTTMTQVMNLVHDLILRRDRESDHLSTVSQNLQSLRTTSAQQSQQFSRLETRNSDLDRQLALALAQERSVHATLRRAETRNRALREEMARLKVSVAQVRAQCATDIRRRDGEIQRLKRHLEGRRARDGTSNQIGVVVVTPAMGKMEHGAKTGNGDVDLDSSEYSLKQETTEFLTQLSQGLSDENDALIGLVRGTLATLRSLQGLPADDAPESGMRGDFGEMSNDKGIMTGLPSYEALAASTDGVLEHLKGLLTNPSFVPLEEVEIREEEIHRLREGWEMMAVRWKEAVALMGGWKKRMLDEGDTINIEDLKVGLKLGSGIPSAQEARHSPLENAEAGCSSSFLDDLKELRSGLDEVTTQGDVKATVIDDTDGIDVLMTDGALGDRSANARPLHPPSKVSIPVVAEENPKALEASGDDMSLLDFSTFKALKPSPAKTKPRIPLQVTFLGPCAV
ncbi:MAG: hypothetical protein Q9217_000007 [Psora testacea]